MCVTRATWTLVVGDWMMLFVRDRLVGAVGGRPLLVVRCWWSLVVGGRLPIVWDKWGCREMALLPQISQGLISTSLSLCSSCTALKALYCTTKNSGNGLNALFILVSLLLLLSQEGFEEGCQLPTSRGRPCRWKGPEMLASWCCGTIELGFIWWRSVTICFWTHRVRNILCQTRQAIVIIV